MTNNDMIQAQNIEVGDTIEDKAGNRHTIVEARDLKSVRRIRLRDDEGRAFIAHYDSCFHLIS